MNKGDRLMGSDSLRPSEISPSRHFYVSGMHDSSDTSVPVGAGVETRYNVPTKVTGTIPVRR